MTPVTKTTDIYLTGRELAARWKLKPQTLTAWRCLGKGPPYVKISYRQVIYRLADVEAYELKSRRRSTVG